LQIAYRRSAALKLSILGQLPVSERSKATFRNPKPSNLTASVGKNTLFGIIANAARVGTRLLTVPFIIHHLGLDGYGVWSIIAATAAYMRFGSAGVKTAFQKYVAEATGSGDYERASQLLSTGCGIMLLLSLAGLIPVAIFSREIARVAGVPQSFLGSTAGAISVLAFITLISNTGAAFEAIVMGGHRIDLLRKTSAVLTLSEAIAIITALHFGHGLAAMAGVMGASELIFLSRCYFASRVVLPQIRVGVQFLTKSVTRELFRFAGSLQLVNVLEIVYGSLLPFAILRIFGADLAGAFAVVGRMVTSAGLIQEAFVASMMSAGAMVFATGSPEKMQALLTKAFKVTLGLSLIPLAFMALFGPTIAYAWTGQTDHHFRAAFCVMCAQAMFASFSLLALVLYRATGGALVDNAREILRIALVVVVIAFGRRLGFIGVLGGAAVAELAGMVLMMFGLTRAFHLFQAKSLLPHAARLTVSVGVMLGVGLIASHAPLPGVLRGRPLAMIKLAEVAIASLLVAWPLMRRTGAVTAAEGRALFGLLLARRSNKAV
jgi:O-antigen/teichoic acid export membrane protein